jgi:D-alanyl-lipoteichoic acid acyltransferase DltB (MBOAT superfamily)
MLRLRVVLPVGISFYTFQTLSYTIDVYRRVMPATGNFFDFALFVGYFPPLVAGPIERAAFLLPKLARPRTITLASTARGVELMLFGFFKKIAIADSVAPSVDAVFASNTATWCDVVGGTLLFAIQIYCDFAGYSDIARGVSKLFGVDLALNFNLPYFSKSPSEFWQRWHISLSSWLRDYLYITLGGNRGSAVATYRNLMVTMVLGGLWHGASRNFVLWGIFHGTLLCAYRLMGSGRPSSAPSEAEATSAGIGRRLTSFASLIFFCMLTLYGWLLFRAHTWEQIVSFTRTLFLGFGDLDCHLPIPTLSGLLGVPLLIAYECTEYLANDRHVTARFPTFVRGALAAAMVFLICMGLSNAPAQFIYFQF